MLAVALMTIGATAGVAPAHAEWRVDGPDGWYRWYQQGERTGRVISPDAFERNAKHIAATVKKFGVGQTVPSGYSGVATQVNNMLSTVAVENTPRSRLIMQKALQTAQRVGTMPLLTGTAWTLTSAVVGWKVGSTLSGKWFGLTSPDTADVDTGPPKAQCPSSSGTIGVGLVPYQAGECYLTQGSTLVGSRMMTAQPPDPYGCDSVANPPGAYGAFVARQGPEIPACGSPLGTGSAIHTVYVFNPHTEGVTGQLGGGFVPVGLGEPVAGQPIEETSGTPAAVPDATAEDKAADAMQDERHDQFIQFVSFHDEFDDGDGELPDPMLPVVPYPGAHEQLSDYQARVEAQDLTPVPQELSDTALSPDHGPNEVVTVSPAPGSSVEPGTEVQVRHNPASAPSPSSWSAPSVRAPDLTPLTTIGSPCDVFPFGVFCWLHETLGGWGTNGSCPSLTIPFTRGDLVFDGCLINPAVDVIRPVLAIVSLIMLVYMFSAAGLGFGGGARDAD